MPLLAAWHGWTVRDSSGHAVLTVGRLDRRVGVDMLYIASSTDAGGVGVDVRGPTPLVVWQRWGTLAELVQWLAWPRAESPG